MTVKNIKPIQHHTANGTSKTFSFNFEVENKENIVVFIDGEPKHPSEYDYFENPRTIQFKVIPTKGSKITVQRVTSLDRSINYQTSDNSFRPEALNKDLDRTWYALQEINAEVGEKVDQTLKINTTGNVIGGGALSNDLTIKLKDQAVTPNKVFGSSTKITSITLNQDGTIKDIGEQPATTGSTSIPIQNNSFQRAALVGDVTAALNSNTTTISNGVVSNTKLTPMPINTLKGSISLGVVQDLSVPQVQKLLNVQDGATKNQTDGYLTNRTNHTGTQPIDTVKDLPEALASKQDNLIAGDHITIKENVITALVDVNKEYVDSELGKKLDKTANAVSASKLETPRTVSFSGAATGSFKYDGSNDSTCALTLSNSGVIAGSYGDNSNIPRITVNAKGIITSVTLNQPRQASTTQTGMVQLVDNVIDSSVDKALTAKQGKGLQDSKLGKTENAVSASKLETPRRINGVLFDGTKDITIAGGEGSGGVSKDYVDQELATKLNKTANAISASKLQTPRSISITGDAIGSTTFDGSIDSSLALTLINSGVEAGTYGTAITTPVFNVDTKGRITKVTNTLITHSSITTRGIVQLSDVLDDTSTVKALTAKQGKILNESITQAKVTANAASNKADQSNIIANEAKETTTTALTTANTAINKADVSSNTANEAKKIAEGAAIKADVAEQNAKMAQNKADVAKSTADEVLAELIESSANMNLLDGVTLVNGGYIDNNNIVQSYDGYSYSKDFIEIKPKGTYIISFGSIFVGIYFDKDKKNIGSIPSGTVEGTTNLEFTTPSTAKYIKVNIFNKDEVKSLTKKKYSVDVEVYPKSVWQDKTIAWYGTSIPAGYPHSTTDDQRDIYSHANLAVHDLNARIINKCVPAGGVGQKCKLSFVRKTDSINYENSLLNLIGTENEPDLVVFDYGVNDYDQSPTDINAFNPNDKLNVKMSIASRDTSTFIGAYNTIIDAMLSKKVSMKFCFITHFSNDNANPNISGKQDFFKQMNIVIQALSEYWSAPILNLHEKTGYKNRNGFNSITSAMPDHIHPATGNGESIESLRNIVRNFLVSIA